MRRALAILLLGAGCRQVLGIEDVTGDASTADTARGGDAADCLGGGLLTVCIGAPPQDVELDGPFDTTVTTCTMVVNQLDAPPLCIVVGRDITLGQNVRVTGARPLVIVATDILDITGTLDVSSASGSAGPGAASCGRDGQPSGSGAGGGAGGSFGGIGGSGGAGGEGLDTPPIAPVTPISIVGGCSGGSGGSNLTGQATPGAGGGAVYLIAGTAILISGDVIASGAGGGAGPLDGAGGGGGGAGGFIGIDAPTLMLDGLFVANGGGGGGGGSSQAAGTAGSDGTRDGVNLAPGGSGGLGGGAGGGTGTVSNDAAMTGFSAEPGDSGGGGGGGGGYGIVYVRSVPTSNGVFSPPLTTTL